jgi:bacterioferritin-associated ferredoxin
VLICLCNGISDKRIRACAENGGCSVAEVYRNHGCQPRCGKCIPYIREILQEAAPGSGEQPAFVEGAVAAPSD